MKERKAEQARAMKIADLDGQISSTRVRIDDLDELIEPENMRDEHSADLRLVLKKGDEVFFKLEGYLLAEARTRRVKHAGTSHGANIRVTKGDRRTGRTSPTPRRCLGAFVRSVRSSLGG